MLYIKSLCKWQGSSLFFVIFAYKMLDFAIKHEPWSSHVNNHISRALCPKYDKLLDNAGAVACEGIWGASSGMN